MIKAVYIFIFINLLAGIAFPQTDWVKWGKADIKYEKPDNFRHRDYSFESENVSGLVVKSAANAYWYFFFRIRW